MAHGALTKEGHLGNYCFQACANRCHQPSQRYSKSAKPRQQRLHRTIAVVPAAQCMSTVAPCGSCLTFPWIPTALFYSGPALPQPRRVAELPYIDTRRTIATAAKLGSLPQLATIGTAMPNSRNTSQCSHCMASKARSANRTSHVSCKCANFRQQLPQLDRPANPAHRLPQRTTTAGSLPAQIPAHVRAAQQAHHKAGNVSMCTGLPAHKRWRCRLTRRNCPRAVPPDSARSGMTSAPSAAVAQL